MKPADIFDFGYGIAEWRRDVHTFWCIIAGWLIVDVPSMLGLLEETGPSALETWHEIKHNGIMAMSIAIISVLKNAALNNEKANEPVLPLPTSPFPKENQPEVVEEKKVRSHHKHKGA